MNQREISGYIGWFKQPLERPKTSKPTMYMVSDWKKGEMDLVLLTPGCFLDAYHHIKIFGAVKTRIFVPSLRMEWISDIFNLYMAAKNITDIMWVFPERSDHHTFEQGHILSHAYNNEENPICGVSYVKNDNVDDVYDLIIYDSDGGHYFSQYLSEEEYSQLLEKESECVDIHIPYRSTVYGGLSYMELYEKDPAFARTKCVPHSFLSVADYYLFHEMKNVNRGKVAHDFIQ